MSCILKNCLLLHVYNNSKHLIGISIAINSCNRFFIAFEYFQHISNTSSIFTRLFHCIGFVNKNATQEFGTDSVIPVNGPVISLTHIMKKRYMWCKNFICKILICLVWKLFYRLIFIDQKKYLPNQKSSPLKRFVLTEELNFKICQVHNFQTSVYLRCLGL